MSMPALRVAIVGGGIGGTAAANALPRRGMQVQVYEQASALTEVGAGVALQPNSVPLLRRLGFGADTVRLDGVPGIIPAASASRGERCLHVHRLPPYRSGSSPVTGRHLDHRRRRYAIRRSRRVTRVD